MANNKYARFFALLKQVNTNGLPLTKEDAILDFTNDRTSSLSDLTYWELQELERSLSAMTVSKQGQLVATPGGGMPTRKMTREERTRDTMRKGIIAIFKSVGRTTGDAIAWAEKYGVFGEKRKFNDYSEQELWQLIRNAEQMKKDLQTKVGKDGVQ